jgi:hypothetical protein
MRADTMEASVCDQKVKGVMVGKVNFIPAAEPNGLWASLRRASRGAQNWQK